MTIFRIGSVPILLRAMFSERNSRSTSWLLAELADGAATLNEPRATTSARPRDACIRIAIISLDSPPRIGSLPCWRLRLLVLVEDQMPSEERQQTCIDPTIHAPIPIAPDAVIFFGLVRNAKLVKFVAEGYGGINVILDAITARPVKLQAAQGFQIVGVFCNHFVQKEALAQSSRNCCVDNQRASALTRLQVDVERRLVKVRHAGLIDRGEDLAGVVFLTSSRDLALASRFQSGFENIVCIPEPTPAG